MPSNHLKTGQNGETLAVNHLIRNGFAIRDRNWRHGKGEIDIVAQKDDLLIVVEVKTRTSGTHLETAEAVNFKKQELLKTTAEHYLETHQLELEIRFDIVSIILQPQVEIEHIPWAF